MTGERILVWLLAIFSIPFAAGADCTIWNAMIMTNTSHNDCDEEDGDFVVITEIVILLLLWFVLFLWCFKPNFSFKLDDAPILAGAFGTIAAVTRKAFGF